MSQKNSILKSRQSESSSSKKRVSWGKKSILEFSNINNTQETENSDCDESPLLTPSAAPIVRTSNSTIKSLEPLLVDMEINKSQYLSPVIEEDELKITNSTRSSYETPYTSNYSIHDTSPSRFKEINWNDTSFKRTIKCTPRKDFEAENSISNLKEQVVRYEAELKIASLQNDCLKKKHEEIRQQHQFFDTSIQEFIMKNRIQKDLATKQFNKMINEIQHLQEKSIIDSSSEER